MELDCPHLSLAPNWADEVDQRRVVLVRAIDGLRLCRDGSFEEERASVVLWVYERESHRLAWEVRDFAAATRLADPYAIDCQDDELVDLVRAAIKCGRLVGVTEGEADLSALDPSQHLLLEQRKTARDLAPILKTFPLPGGRRCLLVPGIDLDRLAGRDSYHVVPRAEAMTMLDTLTGNLRINPNSRSAVAKAIELLSPDWRPPRPPQGLVLLREVSRVASTARQDEVMTPSQMRALMEKEQAVNLEIVVLGLDDKPLQDIQFTIEAPDGESHEGDLGSSGKTKIVSSKKGTASVTLAWAESGEGN